MKIFVRYSLLFLAFSLGICLAGDEIVLTQNKFSGQLKAELANRIGFFKHNKEILIQLKAKAIMPLEFSKGKGLIKSDGILSEGDTFAWPGCGFDRSTFQIYKITPEYVEIHYSRGTPQMDGYQDSGMFQVSFEKGEQGAAANP
jgi:hypothetical protein